jgi:magnesium chelatase family protein
MGSAEVRTHRQLDGAGQRPCANYTSPRAYYRVLKLACTIANLAGAQDIGPAHLAEAIQYRPRKCSRSSPPS